MNRDGGADQPSGAGSEPELLRCRAIQFEAQPYLGIRLTARIGDLGDLMGPLFRQIQGFIEEIGEEPAGGPFTIYHAFRGTDYIVVEGGIPVATPMAGRDRIRAGELPAGTVATVSYRGDPSGRIQASSMLRQWIRSQNLEPAGPLRESYVYGPDDENNPERWRVDFYVSVR